MQNSSLRVIHLPAFGLRSQTDRKRLGCHICYLLSPGSDCLSGSWFWKDETDLWKASKLLEDFSCPALVLLLLFATVGHTQPVRAEFSTSTAPLLNRVPEIFNYFLRFLGDEGDIFFAWDMKLKNLRQPSCSPFFLDLKSNFILFYFFTLSSLLLWSHLEQTFLWGWEAELALVSWQQMVFPLFYFFPLDLKFANLRRWQKGIPSAFLEGFSSCPKLSLQKISLRDIFWSWDSETGH